MRPGFVRDTVVTLLVLSLFLGGVSAYAGTWPPAVIVESGSMMHADAATGYGRVGTIDPGDLVLVKAAEGAAGVETLVENGPERYGLPGDVVVYRREGRVAATPIIHRAIAYVEPVAGEGYRVRWDPEAACVGGAVKDAADAAWCLYGPEGVDLAEVPGAGDVTLRPHRAGFITKGDNPASNRETDQAFGIAPDVVPAELVEGKARGEVPWVGLLKLALAGKPNQADPPREWVKVGSAYAPGDLWVMLTVSVGLFVGAPLAWDAWKARAARRRAE